MEPTSIPGLAFSMGSSSGSVLSSSLAVCSPEALPTDPTTIVPMTTSNDVETTGHQAQQLASVFGSVTMSTAQKSPSLPQPNQHSEHDNLALLRSLGPLDETQSRARLEDRISGAGSLPILLQSAGSNAGTSVKEVACNPTFRAIPCIDPMTSPAFPRSQLADNQNLIYTGLPVEHHHAQNPHTSSLETAANLLHGSTTHGNDLFADRRLDLSIQPPSGGRFAYSSAHEGTPFQPSIDQQIIQSTMTPRDPTLFHSQNVHLLDRQQAMSQLSIAHVLANAPLSGNSVMAGKQIYSPAGPGDMSIQPSARSHGSTHNQGGRLSIDQRIASQSPAVIQDNDPPSDDLNRGRISSPVGRQLGAVMPQGSTPAYDQATQVLMDKQTMNPRYSPWQPVDEYYGTRFELSNHQESRLSPGLQYSSLPRFGQTSLLGNAHGHYYEQRAANQQLVADRALSGLPAPESFDIASHQNNRSQDQHALGVRPFRGDHGSSNLQGHFSWDQSYERQRPEYYHPTTSWHIPNDMTYQPVARRPIFGFSSLDEAQAFEPLPRKRELQFSNTHRALAEEQHRQSNVQNIADPNHQSGKVSFAFPAGRDTAKAPHPFERPVSDFPTIRSSTQAHTVKQEHVSPKPLDDLRKSDDEQFVANTTPEFWDQFALSKFSASKDLDNLHHADNGKGSNNPRFGQVSLDDPRAKLEPGEILEYGSVKSPEASLTSVYYHPGASGTPVSIHLMDLKLPF